MKKITLTRALFAATLAAAISSSALAASPEVLQAVLASKVIGNVTDITKVEVVAVGRCPNCFEVLLTGRNPLGAAYVKVQTESTGATGPVNVRYLEASK